MKMALKHQKDEFWVMPLKHVLSVMGVLDHPGTPKWWAKLTKAAINAKTTIFSSFLSKMYRLSYSL
jgi:hypothetical protein